MKISIISNTHPYSTSIHILIFISMFLHIWCNSLYLCYYSQQQGRKEFLLTWVSWVRTHPTPSKDSKPSKWLRYWHHSITLSLFYCCWWLPVWSDCSVSLSVIQHTSSLLSPFFPTLMWTKAHTKKYFSISVLKCPCLRLLSPRLTYLLLQ